MPLDAVHIRLAEIRDPSSDEAAHGREDPLDHNCVRFVAGTAREPSRRLAQASLDREDIGFGRWCGSTGRHPTGARSPVPRRRGPQEPTGHARYEDIRGRISEAPKWHDANGTEYEGRFDLQRGGHESPGRPCGATSASLPDAMPAASGHATCAPSTTSTCWRPSARSQGMSTRACWARTTWARRRLPRS